MNKYLPEMMEHSNAPKVDLQKHTFAYSVLYENVPRFLEVARELETERTQKIRITVDSSDEKGVVLKLEADFITCIMLATDVADKFRGGVTLIPF